MAPTIAHLSLNANLKGTQVGSDQTTAVHHYRGIRYATIPQRFAKAEPIDDWHGAELDCSRFGPQCPQNHVEVGYLLRIPEELEEGRDEFEQDEFRCLNINVSVPLGHPSTMELLPVLIWIHGGSQVVSYPPVAHRCSDTTPLIRRSVEIGKPLIIVTFNYRLNIFGFGDGTEKNLALKDQRLAIDWVIKHIAGFGGDKDQITLGGESAGAVYVHAHLTTSVPVARGILQSGSLYLSPPQPHEKGTQLLSNLSAHLRTDNTTLQAAPVPLLLQQLQSSNINTLWLQAEPTLENWEARISILPPLLIGDVEQEAIIWRNGLEPVPATEIAAAFGPADSLRALYGVTSSRPTAAKLGALDFLTDARFALPVEDIVAARRAARQPTYQYLFDQANPWQSSSRAHHAVDLIFLFGAYDEELARTNPAAAAVACEMQERWIAFVGGGAPWEDADSRFAFGPLGRSGEIGDDEFAARRRVRHFAALRETAPEILGGIFGRLAAGRISLLN